MEKEERLIWQQKHRKLTGNKSTHAYEKTQQGFLMRLYRNMKSRILGINKNKAHLYKDKCLLEKELFYEWAKCSPMFMVLFRQYEENGFKRRDAPSVDRKDSSKGYSLDNMEWVTMAVNSQRGAQARHANFSHT